MSKTIAFTILGQPCSKANSRKLVVIAKKPQFIKSEDALQYERDALRQIPPAARMRIEGPVRLIMRLFYASERPDLDESLVLDVLQDRWKHDPRGERVLVQSGVYRNDRQVREKHIYHRIDRVNPRAEIIIEPLQAQQVELLPPQPQPELTTALPTIAKSKPKSPPKVPCKTEVVFDDDDCPF